MKRLFFAVIATFLTSPLFAQAPTRSGQPYAEATACGKAGVILCEDFDYPANFTCPGGQTRWANPGLSSNTPDGGTSQPCAGLTFPATSGFPAQPTGSPTGGYVKRVDIATGAGYSSGCLWSDCNRNTTDDPTGKTYTNGLPISNDLYVRFQILFSDSPAYHFPSFDHKIFFQWPDRYVDKPSANVDAGFYLTPDIFCSGINTHFNDAIGFRVGDNSCAFKHYPGDVTFGCSPAQPEHQEYCTGAGTGNSGIPVSQTNPPDDTPHPGTMFRFQTGKWYTFEYRYKLSTAGVNDGIIETWINGVKIYSNSDLATCGSGIGGCAATAEFVQYFWFNSFQEGGGLQGYGLLDNLIISKAYIGPPATAPVYAPTYYVSKTGSDSHSCSTTDSAATNKLTIMGASGGHSCMQPGDTLIVHAGTYAEALSNVTSGTAGNVKTIQGATGETVTIAPTATSSPGALWTNKRYIKLKGLILDGSSVGGTSGDGIKMDSSSGTVATASDHITLEDMNIHHWDNMGVSIGKYANNLTIRGTSVAGTAGGCKIHDNGDALPTVNQDHGFYIRGTDNLIENCEIDHMAYGSGIQIYDDTAANSSISNNIIRKNIFHHNRLCSTINYSSNTLFYDNICYASTVTGGVNLQFGGPNNDKIYNNTFYTGSGAGPWTSNGTGTTYGALYIGSAAANVQVRNNIFYGGSVSEQITNLGSNSTFSNNFCGNVQTNLCSIPTSGTANPLFVSTTTPDFHLQSTSPAIGTGVTIASVPDDFAGTTRPQGLAPDPGAYEYVTGPATITLLSPSGGTYAVGSAQSVTWSSNGAGANVDITEDQDGNGTYETAIATGVTNNGTRAWTVSGGANSNRKMKVKDSAAATFGVSPLVYAVTVSAPGTITLVYPTAGLRFYPGQTVPITWTSTGITGNVNIYISYTNGTYYQPTAIVANFPYNQADATWTATGPSGTTVKFKVASATDPTVFGETAAFTIAGTSLSIR